MSSGNVVAADHGPCKSDAVNQRHQPAGNTANYLYPKNCPLGIDHKIQFRVWDCRDNRFAIECQKDCRAIIHEDRRRVVFQAHLLDGLGLRYIGHDPFEWRCLTTSGTKVLKS